jgi:hypothetical protein
MFARELAEALAVVDALERDGVVAEARSAFVGGTAAPARPAVYRRGWLWVATAAAAGIAIYFALRPSRAPEPDDFSLGSGVRCVEPVGASDSFALFVWTLGDTGVDTKLTVRAEGASDTALEPVKIRGASEWRPDEAERAGWPERIEWTVEVTDVTGKHVDTQSAVAWRRR